MPSNLTEIELKGWGDRQVDPDTGVWWVKLREPSKILSGDFLRWFASKSIDEYTAKVLVACADKLDHAG